MPPPRKRSFREMLMAGRQSINVDDRRDPRAPNDSAGYPNSGKVGFYSGREFVPPADINVPVPRQGMADFDKQQNLSDRQSSVIARNTMTEKSFPKKRTMREYVK